MRGSRRWRGQWELVLGRIDYYMLLSLGFALGWGGVLPPLVAAWLSNLVFGSAGLLSLWRLRG